MLIVDAEVRGWKGISIRICGGGIVEVGRGLRPDAGEDVLDAAGGAVIPGLHDHHVHLRAMAAAIGSIDVGPTANADAHADADAFADRLRTAPPGDWIRAVGYHESVAGPLDRQRLDAVVPERPVRVQHRSGELWVLNTPALDRIGSREIHPTGRLWRMDRWLAEVVPPVPLDFAAVSRRAAIHGVVGFTDADPSRTPADVELLTAAPLRQHLTLMGRDGPRKLLLDDATLPPHDELTAWLAAAHDDGEPVAIHCVTRLQIVAALTALDEAGARPGDRIEHGGIIPPELYRDLERLGVTVVTQPNFVAERGDTYLDAVEPDDVPFLYPCASLRAAGIAVAAGTDAPFGGPDPWAAMRAAVHRRTLSDHVLGPGERIDPETALGLFLGEAHSPATPRRVAPGQPADLCILDRPIEQLYAALADPDPDPDPSRDNDLQPVAATIVDGEPIEIPTAG